MVFLGKTIESLEKYHKQLPCERCGTSYNPSKFSKCPKCGEMPDSLLSEELAKRKVANGSERNMGYWFFFFVLIILFGLIVFL